jgi:hypothetical protein
MFEDTGLDDPYVPPTIDESYATLEKLIGFDLRADLLDQLTDDYGLWVSSSSLANADDLTAVVVSGASDPATVEASVDRLLTLLRLDSSGEVRFNRIQVDGATVTEILVPDGTSTGPLRITVGVVDGQLLIGVGSGMEQYLDGPPTNPLSDSSRFEAAFDALPDDDGGRLYLDVNALIDPRGGRTRRSAPPTPPSWRRSTASRRSGPSPRMEDETQVTSVVLTIDEGTVTPDDDGTPDTSPDTDASPVAAGSGLAVTDATYLELDARTILAMSPSDGALLTRDQEAGELCVVTSAGETEVCAPYAESVDELHVAWSPDGRRVAFTQEAVRFLVDSDLLVLDRDAGEIQNWTDDGYVGGLPLFGDESDGQPSTYAVDLTPTWTPDGGAIVFARSAVGDDFSSSATIIYRIDEAGAEPERVAPGRAVPVRDLLRDGLRTGRAADLHQQQRRPGQPAAGLYELSADGRSVRQVLGVGGGGRPALPARRHVGELGADRLPGNGVGLRRRGRHVRY